MASLPRKRGIFPGVLIRYKRKKTQVNYQTDTDSENEVIDELHVNIWELENRAFFDIGIKIADYDNIDSVIVDIPWNIEKKDIIDLGAKLSSEKSIAAIFNDVVSYSSRDESNFAEVSIGDNSLILVRLNSESFAEERIAVESGVSISRVKITLPEILQPQPVNGTKSSTNKEKRSSTDAYIRPKSPEIIERPSSNEKYSAVSKYIRFRIGNIPRSIYTVELEKKDKNILSSDIKTKIIDFRINVRRGIPDALRAAENGLVFPQFKKMHCFLTKVNKEECHSQSSSYKGYRSLLDEDIWSEYISSEVVPNKKNIPSNVSNYLGHQWTSTDKGEGVKDLIMMARFVSVESSYTHAIRFIILVIIFGAIGSGTWTLLTTKEDKESISTIIAYLAFTSLIIIFIDRIMNCIFYLLWRGRKFYKEVKSWFKGRVNEHGE